MATRGNKSAAKKAATKKAASNQKAAAKRTANKSDDPSAKFGDANTETQKAAAGFVQAGTDPALAADPSLQGAVRSRESRIQSAVNQQRAAAKEAEAEARKASEAATTEHAHVMNELEAPLRAPTDNAMQKPIDPGQQGVHPDVTSPTNLMASQTPALPGTGVADPRDLAPGQDMSPSPPVSSSNILPQPDKPGTDFSKL